MALFTTLMWVAHTLGFESAIGIRAGHKDVRALVEWALRRIRTREEPPESAGLEEGTCHLV